MLRHALAFGLLLACDEHAHATTSELAHERTSAVEQPDTGDSMTPAQRFATTFLSSTCDVRETMIRYPERNQANLRALVPCATRRADRVAATCTPLPTDTTECWIGVGLENDFVLAPRDGGGYLLDVRASMHSPSLATVLSRMSETPTVVRAYAKLADGASCAKDATYTCVELMDRVDVHAYVLKSSPTGNVARTALQDGKEHTVTVVVSYPHGATDAHVAALERFLNTGYDETEGEHAYDAKKSP